MCPKAASDSAGGVEDDTHGSDCPDLQPACDLGDPPGGGPRRNVEPGDSQEAFLDRGTAGKAVADPQGGARADEREAQGAASSSRRASREDEVRRLRAGAEGRVREGAGQAAGGQARVLRK